MLVHTQFVIEYMHVVYIYADNLYLPELKQIVLQENEGQILDLVGSSTNSQNKVAQYTLIRIEHESSTWIVLIGRMDSFPVPRVPEMLLMIT